MFTVAAKTDRQQNNNPKTTKNSFEVDKMDYIVVGIMNVAV